MNTAAIFIDTSAFYAIFARSDENHAAAAALLVALQRERTQLVTSSFVLLESFILVHARTGTEGLLRFRSGVAGSRWLRTVTVEDAQEKRAWALLREQTDQDYSLVDTTSFVVMADLSVSRAFTFDGHFRIAGFEMLPSEPAAGRAQIGRRRRRRA